MRPMSSCLAMATCLAVAVPTALPAQGEITFCNPKHKREIDLTVERKNPLLVEGPSELTLKPLNRLRYDVVLGDEVVTGAGPDLSVLGFIPALPAAVKTAAAKEVSKPTEGAGTAASGKAVMEKAARVMSREVRSGDRVSYEDLLAQFRSELFAQPVAGLVAWASAWRSPLERLQIRDQHLVEHVFLRLQAEVSAAEADLDEIRTDATATKLALEGARDRLHGLVRRSDQILRDSPAGVAELIREIALVRPVVDSAVASKWPRPKVEELATKLRQIGDEFEKLQVLEGFSTWRQECDPIAGLCNGRRYKAALEDVDRLSEALSFFFQGGEAWKAQSELRAGLETWSSRLGALREASFVQKHRVACDYPFFRSRTNKVYLVLTDRLEQDSSKATRTIQVAEIECPSHFSVTAGVGVARIDERDIAFVAAPAPAEPDDEEEGDEEEGDEDTAGLTKVFGFENRSEEQINPTFLISTRLCQRPSWDVHLSFGTTLDFDRPKDGSVFGYLGGATLTIKDQLFMTLGLQGQRVPELAGGFEIGDEVPADLTAPPLEKDWAFGPVFAVTYKVN